MTHFQHETAIVDGGRHAVRIDLAVGRVRRAALGHPLQRHDLVFLADLLERDQRLAAISRATEGIAFAQDVIKLQHDAAPRSTVMECALDGREAAVDAEVLTRHEA